MKSLIEVILRIDPLVDIEGGYPNSPLHIAPRCEHHNALSAFLTPCSPGNSTRQTLGSPSQSELKNLWYTFYHMRGMSNPSILQFFFQNGTEFDVFVLLRSCRYNLDGDVSAKTRSSPLSIAAERGYRNFTEFLLSNPNVSPNRQDYLGFTPLSKAAREGRLNVVHLLLQKATNIVVNLQSMDGRSPLSYSAEQGNEYVLKLILS
jgi:hypothetical protein